MLKLGRARVLTATAAALVGVYMIGGAAPASALSTSDRAASILVWPKVVADPAGQFGVCNTPLGKPCSGATAAVDCGPANTCITERTDTFVSIDNTTTGSLAATKLAHCYLINANSHCENSPSTVCNQSSQCAIGGTTGRCVAGWAETDFNLYITTEQPVGWYASQGRSSFAMNQGGTCSLHPALSCLSAAQCPQGETCQVGPSNVGSLIPPVGEVPFQGTIKCIEFDLQNPPVPDHSASANSLIGNAAIISRLPNGAGVDVAKYNAVGLRATANSVAPTNTLQIGRAQNAVTGQPDPTQEYDACPANLILPHLFDGAIDPNAVPPSPGVNTLGGRTDLTLVPCGDDFSAIQPGVVTAQFLVYNEFEQRFSASKKVDCFFEKQLSLIDTSNPLRSIWAAGVAGTLAGQTRIRGVGSANTGRGLLGVARGFERSAVTALESGTAYNLFQQGEPKDGTQPDLIILP